MSRVSLRNYSKIEACKSLTRHVILVQGMDCKLVPPTDWDVGLYCKNEDGLVENYKVGGYKIRSEVSNICLGKMASTQMMRRANLIDCEVIATAKQDGERTKSFHIEPKIQHWNQRWTEQYGWFDC